MTGDHKKLAKLSRDLRGMGDPRAAGQQRLLEPIKRNIRDVVREEFTRSVSPSGESWRLTVRGKAALVSRKLPFAFDFAARDGAVVGVGRSKRDLLDAHQKGMTFRARQVAAHQQYLNFNSKGRLVRENRVFKRTKEVSVVNGQAKVSYSRGDLRRGAYQRFASAHSIRARVLPQRQIIPDGSELPPLWDAAAERGATDGMQRWYEETVK